MRTKTQKYSGVFPFRWVCQRLAVRAANRSADPNTETPYVQSSASSPVLPQNVRRHGYSDLHPVSADWDDERG